MKILTIYAHPADTITNCGGTLARHADNGDDIAALILTHGGRIHPNRYAEEWRKDAPAESVASSGLDDIVAHKRGELERAAEIIGITRIHSLEHDDALGATSSDLVDRAAEVIAEETPDVVICDYPLNAAYTTNPHTEATMVALAAIGRAAFYLKNLDGRAEVNVRQIFFTSYPAFASDVLSLHGVRNDTYIDITPVIGRKIAAMDCFASQGYDGNFSRKIIEGNNGEHGRTAGVNFAEAYIRHYNETHGLLPVTPAAMSADPLTRHIEYSTINVRHEFPVTESE